MGRVTSFVIWEAAALISAAGLAWPGWVTTWSSAALLGGQHESGAGIGHHGQREPAGYLVRHVRDHAVWMGEREDPESGALAHANAEAQVALEVTGLLDLPQGREVGGSAGRGHGKTAAPVSRNSLPSLNATRRYARPGSDARVPFAS
jgi:hypothetical protein